MAACGLAGARLLGSADDTVPVWAVRADGEGLVSGQSVAAGALQARRVRFADQTAADRYLPGDIPIPDGTVVVRDVGAGELLPRSALGSATDTDLVELPLAVPSEGVAGNLKVGDRVDVWVAVKDGPAATLLLDDVAVVALPGEEDALSVTPTRQVVVGLHQAEQDRLPAALAALAAGTVVLTRQAGR